MNENDKSQIEENRPRNYLKNELQQHCYSPPHAKKKMAVDLSFTTISDKKTTTDF